MTESKSQVLHPDVPLVSELTSFQEDVRLFLGILRRNPPYIFGLAIVVFFLVESLIVGLFPWILGYNPVQTNLSASLLPPSLAYPFGTDDLGRSLLLKLLYGLPIDGAIALAIILFSVAFGILTGSIAGYFGGALDEIIMRVTDIFLAFPGLVLAVAVAAALGPGIINVTIAVAVVWWPIYTRIARGETLPTKEQPFVLAAKASGLSRTQIVLSHIMPNVATSMIAYGTADVGNVILLTSVLGYLGLGAQPPRIDLGRIVFDGQNYIGFAPWYPLLPGVVLFVIVISFSLVGDLIRDFLDPSLRT